MDDAELIRIQADTLFTYDGRGRMVRDNYPDGGPAPRLFVGRTRRDAVVRFGATLPDPVVRRLAAVPVCMAVVRDGAAVSVCFSSRIGPWATEAEVETLPDFRGRGYAAAVTAGWGLAVQAAGSIPLYTTSWENFASQGVARRVGLTMYGADRWWT